MAEEQTQERSIKKISETDESYRADQEVVAAISSPLDYAFGYDIACIKDAVSNLPKSSSLIPGFETDKKRYIREARAKLKVLARNPRSKLYLDAFFAESAFDINLGFFGTIVQRFKGGDLPDFEKLFFDVKGVPDKVLEQMIVAHVQRFEIQLKSFDGGVQTWESQFKERITEKIDSGAYPLSAEILARRLQNTKVVLGDALRDDLTSDRGGLFNPETETVLIAQQGLRKYGEKIYTHEMFHALSGRTIVEKKLEFMSERIGISHTQRIGLDFLEGRIGRLRWLDEALTEFLTQDLLSQSDNTYAQERELFGLLQRQGKIPIPQHLFLGAYFENYDPALPHGERIPAWKRLYGVVNDAYSPGFLVRLDDYVKAHGIKGAIKIMKDDWHEIETDHPLPERIR